MAAPTVTGVGPNSGSILGGTVVFVSGTGFSVSPPLVSISGINQSSVVVLNDNSLYFTTVDVPMVTIRLGAGNLLVTTTDGTSAPAGAAVFTYTAPVPSTAVYKDVNPFFDPFASYDQYGNYNFSGNVNFTGTVTGAGSGPVVNAWMTTGNDNAGVSGYLGTTNGDPLRLGTNNQDVLTIDDLQNVTFNTLTGAFDIGTTVFSITASVNILLNSPLIFLNGIGTATAPDILYIDNTGLVTKGAAPSGGSGWDLSGNTGGGHQLGTTDNNSWNMIANNIVYATLDPVTQHFTLGANTLFTEVNGATVNITCATNDMTIQTNTGKLFLIAQAKLNIDSFTDAIEISCPSSTLLATGMAIEIDVIPASVSFVHLAATNAKILGIGNLACVTTQNFNGWTASGIGDIQIFTTTGDVTLGNQGGGSGSLTLVGHTNTSISCDAGNIDILAQLTNSININGSAGTISVNMGTAFTTAVNIGSAIATTTIDGTVFKVPNLPNTAQTNVVLYDEVTKQISYDVVPLSTSAWNITGTNSGALLFGTSNTDGYSFQVNSVEVSSYTTATVTFGSMAFGAGLTLTSATGNAEINGHSFTVSVDTGDINMTTRSTHNININGFAALSAININIGTLLTGLVQIGSLSLPQLTLSGMISDWFAPTSLGLHSPIINVNVEGSARVTTIGNIFAGNDLIVNSISVKIPNLPVATQTDFLYFDSGTGALTQSPVSSLSSNFWNTSGDNLGGSLKIGGGAGTGFEMTADNFSFMTVDPTINVTFDVNSFLLDVVNDVQTISFTNRHDGVGASIGMLVGIANPSTFTLSPTESYLVSHLNVNITANTNNVFLSAPLGSISCTGINVYNTGTGNLFYDAPNIAIGLVATSTIIGIGNSMTVTTINGTNLSLSTLPSYSGPAAGTYNVVSVSGQLKLGSLASESLVTMLATSNTQAISRNVSYITDNTPAVLLVYTLPVSTTVGDTFQIIGSASGGWQIAQNAGQSIYFAAMQSTVGITGSLTSGSAHDCATLVCTETDVFTVVASVGALVVI